MRLVPEASQEKERRRAALERDRVLLARQVDAVDERLAEDVLALLRETDDGQVVKAEVVRRRQRAPELPTPAVDDEEIGSVPAPFLDDRRGGARVRIPARVHAHARGRARAR